jgi:hypothetical protein
VDLAAQLFKIVSDGFQRIAPARASRNGGPGLRELQRYRSADAAAAAADDYSGSFEIDLHRFLEIVVGWLIVTGVQSSPLLKLTAQ